MLENIEMTKRMGMENSSGHLEMFIKVLIMMTKEMGME